MTLRAPHLHDDCLLDCYAAVRQGVAPDPPLAEHLADCRACAERYASFAAFMDELREEGEAETDAIFTADRLLTQKHHIARRIEHVGRAARVISFPNQAASRTVPTTTHSAPRWVAAAAAAGLFLGVALGSYQFEWGARGRTARTVASVVAPDTAGPLTVRTADPAPALAADDAFLSELEIALDRPSTRELQPLDVLTPHVREIRDLR